MSGKEWWETPKKPKNNDTRFVFSRAGSMSFAERKAAAEKVRKNRKNWKAGKMSYQEAQELGVLRPSEMYGAGDIPTEDAYRQGILSPMGFPVIKSDRFAGGEPTFRLQEGYDPNDKRNYLTEWVENRRSKIAEMGPREAWERGLIDKHKAFEFGVLTGDEIAGKHPNLKLDSGSLTFLPAEMLNELFKVLLKEDPITLLGSVPHVCRRLRWLCVGVRGEFNFKRYQWWEQAALSTRNRFLPTVSAVAMYFPGTRITNVDLKTRTELEIRTPYKLPELPRGIKYFTALKTCTLHRTELTMVPNEIGSLEMLEKLTLTRNLLTELPETIGNLTRLNELNLTGNQLKVLPNSIGGLTALTILNVSDNLLTALPQEIKHLTALKTLNVNKNQLTALPHSIGDLTALTNLYVAHNELTALSHSIGRLTALKKLDVTYNKLTALPDSISRLAALEILNVSANRLTALPDSIGRLTALEHLKVYMNQLTALPDSIGRLTALKTLGVSNNQLKTLPDSIGDLRALTHLYVPRNELTALPRSIGRLTALRTLDVSHNKLTELPEEMANTTELRKLDLRENTGLVENLGSLFGYRTTEIMWPDHYYQTVGLE